MKTNDAIRLSHLAALFPVLLILGFTLNAAAAEPFGMVSRLSGSAAYTPAGTQAPADLSPFMRLYDGDAITLQNHASLQIITFSTGRKETWEGPVSLRMDREKGCIPLDPGARPRVDMMPEVVANEVRRISKIIDPSSAQKAGATIVRGVSEEDREPLIAIELDSSEQREIHLAKDTYQSLLKEADPSDITPELFFFSVLADYDQHAEMKKLIAVMKEKQPENATINLLTEWLEEQK